MKSKSPPETLVEVKRITPAEIASLADEIIGPPPAKPVDPASALRRFHEHVPSASARGIPGDYDQAQVLAARKETVDFLLQNSHLSEIHMGDKLTEKAQAQLAAVYYTAHYVPPPEAKNKPGNHLKDAERNAGLFAFEDMQTMLRAIHELRHPPQNGVHR